MKIKLLTLVACSAFLMSGCYYDNFKEIHPESALPSTIPCDTAGVISYSVHIAPLLAANCTQSCHNPNATPGNGNRDLTDFVMVQDATNNGLNPGDGGSLYGTVNWDPNYGNDMPKNAAKLSDCDITKIRKWAMAGGPNN